MELLIINFMEIIGVTVVCLVVSTQMFNAYVNKLYSDYFLKEKNKEINKEKKRGDKLLHNILPKQIAKELMSKGSVTPRYYNSATIMLIDFKDFSTISKRLTPQELIKELDYCFKKFDHLTAKHNLEKIKTIGDAYLCVGGVPNNNITHAMNSIEAAHEILTFLNEWNTKRIANNEPPFESRIGIHTGSIIAGVVGDRKFVFDIWGDAVNTTARIESNGKAGQINISQTTYDLVKTEIECDHRGKIPIKNLDPIDMYFVKKN
ncbi:adenylate/guanylate cyclase domain-containing protein [Saprospiraceae bacterium]|jgi:class 3 adenylate cyclase|nr:adenylate/guanylate cyclase domain-containing protein [Saprospiraceae bacterium]MDF1866413.1 adenylate/guanylate cyclase domain-containing protein [Saprospiraceae bacterium]